MKSNPREGSRETSSLRPSNVISSSGSERAFPPAQIQEQIAIKRGSGALALLLLFFLVDPSLPQSASINPPPQKSDSLGDSLRHSEGKEIHIFYIHGIGSDGPNDYDSLALRRSICAYLRDCTSLAGTPIGEWDYADQGQFQPDATVPELEYMDERVWKSADEWRAAAPYAIHFQLTRANGQNLYVDELNWWPLTFSLKCRHIIASDASFVAPNKARIETCSRREPNLGVPQRFKSYDWITPEEAARMAHLPPKGARANRALKTGLMDWGFSDAVLALGPLRLYLLDGIRQLILKSQGDSRAAGVSDPTRQPVDQEFIIVCHSLGSYLIFSALDINQTTIKTTTVQQSGNRFDQSSSAHRWSSSSRISCDCWNWQASTDPPIETSQRISNRGVNSGATISSLSQAHHRDVGLRALPHSMIQATCSPGQFPTFLASKLRTTRLRTPPAGFGLLRIQPRLTITMRATSALSERCSNRTLRRTSELGCAHDH